MSLKKLTLKAGINKEITRYSAENGWYDCDKVRFRQQFPEKIIQLPLLLLMALLH